jgi:hypothetical protein
MEEVAGGDGGARCYIGLLVKMKKEQKKSNEQHG